MDRADLGMDRADLERREDIDGWAVWCSVEC